MVWVLLPAIGVCCAFTLGVSVCKEWMGTLQRKNSEMFKSCSRLFSCYFAVWLIDFHSRSWSNGQWLLGQFGMLETNIILNIYKPIPSLFLMAQLVFYRSIKGWWLLNHMTKGFNWVFICFVAAVMYGHDLYFAAYLLVCVSLHNLLVCISLHTSVFSFLFTLYSVFLFPLYLDFRAVLYVFVFICYE